MRMAPTPDPQLGTGKPDFLFTTDPAVLQLQRNTIQQQHSIRMLLMQVESLHNTIRLQQQDIRQLKENIEDVAHVALMP